MNQTLVETQNLPEELEDLHLVFPLEFYLTENTIVQVMQVLQDVIMDWLLVSQTIPLFFLSVSIPRLWSQVKHLGYGVSESVVLDAQSSVLSQVHAIRILAYIWVSRSWSCERAVTGSSPWKTAVTQFQKPGSDLQRPGRRAIYSAHDRFKHHLAL